MQVFQKGLEETFVMLEMCPLKLIHPRKGCVQGAPLEQWALEDVRSNSMAPEEEIRRDEIRSKKKCPPFRLSQDQKTKQRAVALVPTMRVTLSEFIAINARTYRRGDLADLTMRSAGLCWQSTGVFYLALTFKGDKGLPSSPVDLCGVNITANHALLLVINWMALSNKGRTYHTFLGSFSPPDFGGRTSGTP